MVRETKNTLFKMGIITTFLVLGTYNSVFDIVAFLVVSVLIIKDDNSVGWIVFLNPFSEIFKLTPTGNTMSTILLILYVIYSIYRKHELNRMFVVRFIIFGVFVLLSSAYDYDIARTIKFFFGILFIYYALSDISNRISIWNVFMFYILGVVISSIVSYSGVIHNATLYFGIDRLGYAYGYQSRFTGMYSDPNYYTVNIIIAICLVEILKINKVISKNYEYLLLLILLAFSFLTLSKSAIILLIVPVFVIMIYYLQIKDFKKFIGVMGLLAVVLLVILSLNIPQITTILGRFTNASDVNSLTTGRFNLWKIYVDYFNNYFGRFLFGSGVGAALVNNRASHNTYIDFIFYFGVIGSILFVYLIMYFNKREYFWKRTIMNYSIYLSIAVAYMALSETFYFDFPIHLFLAATVFRLEDFIKKQIVLQTNQE